MKVNFTRNLLTLLDWKLFSVRPFCTAGQEAQQEGESAEVASRAASTLPPQDVVTSA